MASISSLAAKTRFGQLLARVERGEEVVITKHDRPVARVVPISGANSASVRRAVDDIFAFRAKVKARPARTSPLTFAEIQSARREGRR
jgi:prevent-host-death family protein